MRGQFRQRRHRDSCDVTEKNKDRSRPRQILCVCDSFSIATSPTSFITWRCLHGSGNISLHGMGAGTMTNPRTPATRPQETTAPEHSPAQPSMNNPRTTPRPRKMTTDHNQSGEILPLLGFENCDLAT
uniref:Uncharacterized protein n=1 Tax=Branchiostoma floridae TaxID=7739 RepID=C3XT40_BRAFL|eukprot:XP_002612764.1 hypothetical protein BRAFLDRAFT_128265 [Branchiostoma floridae]